MLIYPGLALERGGAIVFTRVEADFVNGPKRGRAFHEDYAQKKKNGKKL